MDFDPQTMANGFEIKSLKDDVSIIKHSQEKQDSRITSVERFQWMIIGGLVVGNFLQIALRFIKP